MKVTTETVATRQVVLTIEPEADVVQKAMRKAAQQISRWRPLPGFRPGKAPYAMVERSYGREPILDQAVNDMASDLYRAAIEEAKVEPYEQGQLDVATKDPLVLKLTIPLMPVVTLGDYKNLHIDREPDVILTQEQIDAQIEGVRRRHAQYETVERPAQLGDQLVATLQGTADGEQVINQEDATLDLREAMSPPGFAEALVGMQADGAREFSLTYPEDYGDKNLAGKNVAFTVTAKTVRQVNLPEINDDLAKTAGDYETVAQMREDLAANLQRQLEAAVHEREANAAIEALLAQSTVEYPEAALVREINAALQDQRGRLQQMGFEWENYLRMVNSTEEQLRETIRPQAEKRLVRELVLNEIARAEKFTVSESELTRTINGILARYGDRAEQAAQQMRDSGAFMSVYADLLSRKALDYLAAIATGREAPGAVDLDAAPAEPAAAATDAPVSTDAPASTDAPGAES